MKPLLLTFIAILSANVLANDFSTLKFSIENVASDKGKIYVQLFKGEENFASNSPYSSLIFQAAKGSSEITFPNLTEGEYALRYFHDEDNDGKLATNLFGIPTEGYGFSSNVQPNMGPPSFKDAKFTIDTQSLVVINNSTVIY